jgi:hypothetical protein
MLYLRSTKAIIGVFIRCEDNADDKYPPRNATAEVNR